MARPKFPLSSDQLELLFAFDATSGLAELSQKMAKDPSVVSRNLQRLAEDCPVLLKVTGRWQLTPLGHEVIHLSRHFLNDLQKAIRAQNSTLGDVKKHISKNAALMIINAQRGLLDPSLGGRNNADAEERIHKILSAWRARQLTIIHAQHLSENAGSAFYKNSPGAEFMEGFFPAPGEIIIGKSKASAFVDTALEGLLKKNGITTLFIVGFTANECVDATTRHAKDLGFLTYVVGDATASFDVAGPEGTFIKAQNVHEITMANLHALFAQVIDTQSFLRGIG